MPNILGVSAYFHDAACCLLRDGQLVAAAQEERFSRRKHDPSLPKMALHYCLAEGGVSISDIDCLAYYEDPVKKLDRQIYMMLQQPSQEMAYRVWRNVKRPTMEIRDLMGYEGPIEIFEHHQAHAASSFFFSGFPEAAILTVDGVGEWATTTYGRAEGKTLELFDEVSFPDSLGLLYSTITSYLGFAVNDGEYKVMGLAPYGKPVYADKIRSLIQTQADGQYRLNLTYFEFNRWDRMYSEALPELLGQAPRKAESALSAFHKDVARSMQVVLEEVLLEKVRYLHRRTGGENLCMAGGVALNCVANGRILKDGPFKRLFVQPAAGDAGTCLGAAALAHVKLTGERPRQERLEHVNLGPGFSSSEIARLLGDTSIVLRITEAMKRSCSRRRLIGWPAEKLSAGFMVEWNSVRERSEQGLFSPTRANPTCGTASTRS
jgi:carbamoyltransferase